MSSNIPYQSFTFNNFVVGNSNRFAYSACKGVAENPGFVYNPLFIYSGVGLGKTHLMCAVGNYIASHNKNAIVVYTSIEKFMNELMESIEQGQVEEFRKKYRKVDCLLIDDIEFLAGQDRTQKEFVYTFDALYANEKQIILTSDRPPKDLDVIQERVKSRFEGGLIVDIQPPDFETRVAILKKKAEARETEIDQSVIYEIADKIKSNIRELEGALNKVIALSSITKQPITLELANKVLQELTGEPIQKIVPSAGVPTGDEVNDEIFSDFLTDIKDDVLETIVGREEIVKAKEEFQKKIYIWEMKGFEVSKLRESLNLDIKQIEKIFDDYTKSVKKLVDIQKQIASMDVRGYEDEYREIESMLFDPNHIDELVIKVKSLQEKIDRREQYRDELLPEFTFENLIIGEFNRLAYSTARSVAQKPGKEYNPLFIYGGKGSGKTHFLYAIGNYINNHDAASTLYFTNAESFINEVITSIENNKIEEFRNKYRDIDILLVDDIHLFANKERTQEEFFYCFNTLYASEKQIVVTSTKPPKELTEIKDRLRSRFESGLVVEIKLPDLRDRISILQKMIGEKKIEISDDAVVGLAEGLTGGFLSLKNFVEKLYKYYIENKKAIDKNTALNLAGISIEVPKIPKEATTPVKKVKNAELDEKLVENWGFDEERLEMEF